MSMNYMSVFLGGALAASIALNFTQYQKPEAAGQEPQSPDHYAELDLTPAQVGVLNRCGTVSCFAAAQLRAESEAVTDELRVALSAPEMDEDYVKELAAKLCELRTREVDNNIATLLEVRNALEPQQVRALYRVLYPEQGQ